MMAAFHEPSFHHRQTSGLSLDGRLLGRRRDSPARWEKKLRTFREHFFHNKPTAGQRRWAFCFTALARQTKPSHMITENPTRFAEPSRRAAATPLPADPVGALIRVYRQAGLSTETARRCAVADFRCVFPQLLGTGV